MLDPWLTSDAHDDVLTTEEPCPICLAVVHTPSRQLPRVQCATCRNGFHANCIYRWLEHGRTRGEESGRCPMCRGSL